MKGNLTPNELTNHSLKIRGADGIEGCPDQLGIYLWAASQYFLYPIIAAVSWWNISTGWALCWSLPLALALYNIWMIGHDACHNAVFRPNAPKLNQILAFLTLDCLIVTRKTWLQTHHVEHHPFPNSSVDGQRLEGETMLEELWNVWLLLLEYLYMDIKDCYQTPTFLKIVTLLFRYALLFSIGWGMPLVIFWALFFSAYFGLTSHSAEPLPHATTFRQKQLSNTVDFMPGNWLAEFLTGGLNTHAVHHVWPHLPRGLHGWASRKLQELEPDFYRSYTFKESLVFWWNRTNPKPKKELPSSEQYYQ